MLTLLIALALGRPTILVVPVVDGPTAYILKDASGSRFREDAWSFATHYDPNVRAGLAGRVQGRRAGLGVTLGVAGTAAGLGFLLNLDSRAVVPEAAVLVGAGGLIAAIAPLWYFSRKKTFLRPALHWTMHEAQILASGRRVAAPLSIVEGPDGWAVINRSGRVLEAVEVAGRLQDRYVLRRIQRANTSLTVVSAVLATGGLALVAGGTALATYPGEANDKRLTGVAAIGAGVLMLPAGWAVQRLQRRRRVARYWDRRTLEALLEPAEPLTAAPPR